jgi:hypothetical protein
VDTVFNGSFFHLKKKKADVNRLHCCAVPPVVPVRASCSEYVSGARPCPSRTFRAPPVTGAARCGWAEADGDVSACWACRPGGQPLAQRQRSPDGGTVLESLPSQKRGGVFRAVSALVPATCFVVPCWVCPLNSRAPFPAASLLSSHPYPQGSPC